MKQAAKATHTPGPWKVSASALADNANDYAIYVMRDDRRQIIAEAFGRSDWQHTHPSDANARLIAAAPELLEACSTLVQVIEQLVPEPSVRGVADVVLFQARAAIAKAVPS